MGRLKDQHSDMCDTAEVYADTAKVHKREWLTLEGVMENELQQYT